MGDSSNASTVFTREETLQKGASSRCQNPLPHTDLDLEEIQGMGVQGMFSWTRKLFKG
jgi:hypothetical protein